MARPDRMGEVDGGPWQTLPFGAMVLLHLSDCCSASLPATRQERRVSPSTASFSSQKARPCHPAAFKTASFTTNTRDDDKSPATHRNGWGGDVLKLLAHKLHSVWKLGREPRSPSYLYHLHNLKWGVGAPPHHGQVLLVGIHLEAELGCCSQNLPGMCEAMSSMPSTTQRHKTDKYS